jgi:methylmalonyl-CoA mutase
MAESTEKPKNRLRFVTATSLFDGHDAAINIMRRILQAEGAEVIHLGHDRSVDEIVRAAVQEDAHGIAVSSYQGGHVEFFRYMVDSLRAAGRGELPVFGGGGGTITDREAAELHEHGVARIYSVEDGRQMGLVGMIRDMMGRADRDLLGTPDAPPDATLLGQALRGGDETNGPALARTLTLVEALGDRATVDEDAAARLRAIRAGLDAAGEGPPAPVVGITGTGGAGKSSLTDELVRRFRARYPDRALAVLSVDPTRRRTGGALLGDRIRMNAVFGEGVFMRSLATRQANASVSATVADALALLKRAGFALVILETAGIGQSGSEVVDLSDHSIYVMTPEFGAPSQLEKIDMLDFADLVAINKADKRGADDALRHVAKQVQRNRAAFDKAPSEMPVYLCSASHFGDAGVDRLFGALCERLGWTDALANEAARPDAAEYDPGSARGVLPPARVRYLAEIAEAVRAYKANGAEQARLAAEADGLQRALRSLGAPGAAPGRRLDDPPPPSATSTTPSTERSAQDPVHERLAARYHEVLDAIEPDARALLAEAPAVRAAYSADENRYEVRGRELRVANYTETLSGLRVPKVAVPGVEDWGELLRWRWLENVPGAFPFTAGVFPYKRAGEDPTRMFAGEGPPERTNRRFHFLAQGQPAARLSTAFDSVTLYGREPHERPDIYGKIGNSGVSVATLDDAKRLYSGFDLCDPKTSVSMTINGPAPMILAMFLNTAIDQQVERRLRETGRWEQAAARISDLCPEAVRYRGPLPAGHDGGGLGLLGVSGDLLLEPAEYAEVRAATLRQVRGTVQADILKEDQAQNTCIFSTDFALELMGDIQAYFTEHDVQNFYSVSISGYHIAEAGANPITQLAFTLANGFTYVEYYLSRGLSIDDFARNLSFFFSNGIDAEYSVIGRVARRIWAIAMRERYEGNARSQQLKYHIQTSGRSLHAQEIQFNDIRTTLQALYAIADNCNSLHTNAYDEAITTPTEASVRRALAIQLILNRELGLLKNENPLQGAYLTDYLTDLVEEAVLSEFERLTDRGGVLGAMELMYQRSRIQEESLVYEQRKHSGELPIIGVNTFLDPHAEVGKVVETELIRSTDDEKAEQIAGLRQFQRQHRATAPAALDRLEAVAVSGGNVFAELMETVKRCSLGQISERLFAVGGQYRRSM